MFQKPKTPADPSALGKLLVENVRGWIDPSLPQITNLANFSALLMAFLEDVSWAGFYLWDGKRLILGPFQGLPACTEIALGKGVCGTAAQTRQTVVVEDVDKFPGHIACDSASRSEIVVPIVKRDGTLFGVLDLDSPLLSRFKETEKKVLEDVVELLVDIL